MVTYGNWYPMQVDIYVKQKGVEYCPPPKYMAAKNHGFAIRFGGAKPNIQPTIA